MCNKKGVLAVVSGPSGCGKGTVLRHVLKNEEYAISVSATTRAPRAGEEDGVHYFFISEQDFLKRVEGDKFLEHAKYCGNHYGSLRDYVDNLRCQGKHVILEIETAGAFMVKSNAPDALLLFIAPPDMQTLEKRLRGRGTEKEEIILERLAKGAEEMKLMHKYDRCIINYDDGDKQAADEIMEAITAYHNRSN